MSHTDNFDLVIVGAGPAGLSTALHLAKLAPDLVLRTLILEKAHHPRTKLCGGGLLPDAEAILHSLGLDLMEVPHCDIDWAHFDYDGRGMRMRAEKHGAIAFRTIRRHEFDAWLADKTRQKGFTFQEDTFVKSAKVTGSQVILETNNGELHCHAVVGADGSKSVIRRVVIPFEKTHTARLLEIVTPAKPEASIHIQANSYFDFLYVDRGILGYTWDFPALENGQPVRIRGIFDSNVHPTKKDISLVDALGEEFARHGLSLDEFKMEGAPLRWFEPALPISIPRVLLVGDAAGSDALFGEGISMALGYGYHAAQAIHSAFASQDFSFSNYKKSILRSAMGRALQRRTWMAKLFYFLRPCFIQKLVWRKLGWLVEWVMQSFMIGWAKR